MGCKSSKTRTRPAPPALSCPAVASTTAGNTEVPNGATSLSNQGALEEIAMVKTVNSAIDEEARGGDLAVHAPVRAGGDDLLILMTDPSRAGDNSAKQASNNIVEKTKAADRPVTNRTSNGLPSKPNSARATSYNSSALSRQYDESVVCLPKGDWIHTEGTEYYYSIEENLYYHPPSRQFYDPSNEMWYDPTKDEWYHDDDEGDGESC